VRIIFLQVIHCNVIIGGNKIRHMHGVQNVDDNKNS